MGIRESLLNTITSVADSDFVRIVTSAGASSKATVQNLFKSFEAGLGAKSSLTTSDYIRVVGSDDVAYKQSLSSIMNAIGLTTYEAVSGTDLITKLKSLAVGTYFYRMDNVSGFPVTGGVVFRIVKTHGVNDTRASIIAIPMDSTANVYTAFVPASATSITWTALPTRAEVDALNSKTTQTFTSSTATGSGTASKVGQVVTVHLSFEGYTATSTSWQPLCELPSGYRPSRQIDVLAFDNAARSTSEQPLQLRISPSGTVKLYAFTAKTYNPYGCVTFII